MVELFNIYATIFFFLVIGFPLIGAGILFKGFQLAKVSGFPFFKCFKIYLAGLLYCYLIVWTALLIMKPADPRVTAEAPIAPILRTILFYVIPMVAIPLLGRDLSRRTIVVELVAILVANTVMIIAAYVILPFLLPVDSTSAAPMRRGTVNGVSPGNPASGK